MSSWLGGNSYNSYKKFKSSQKNNNLGEPLLLATYSDEEEDDEFAILDHLDSIMNHNDDKMVELPTYLNNGGSPVVDSDSSDDESKSDNHGNDQQIDGEATTTTLKPESPNDIPLDELFSDTDIDLPDFKRKSTAKVIINEDIKLSRKYEKYLTIDNDEIIDKNDKIDALILQLKLPYIYTLPDDEQYSIIQEKYSWIDDEDGEIDQFQYEEIQEVVSHMTAIERRHMYDTIEQYDEGDEDIKEEYKLEPAQLKTMRRFKKMQQGQKTYVCSGCGVLLKYKQKKIIKNSKAWRGYFCKKTGREFIFHNRLCVKFRKAKEFIRDAVYQYDIEQGNVNSSRMQIDFLKDEDLDSEFQPNSFYTTFDETEKKKVSWTKTIRKYYTECVNTDLRGYDIDEGDRFSSIPTAIKYLDMREFAIPMFKYLIREVQIKEFSLFWQFIQFFVSYIHTPKLIELLRDSSDVLFPLHDDTNTGETKSNDLIDFLTIICEGALYPIATCLYISAYIKENGENYWNEQATQILAKHFRNMANTIIDEIESEHLVAIILETPTNIYDQDDDETNSFEQQQQGLSVIDIAIKYKMLKFLQNHKISRIATSLWYERKVIHPKKRFGEDLSFYDLFQRLVKTPAKFYFSPSGLNIVRLGLYTTYLALFSYVTYAAQYNYEQAGDAENLLWLFNIAAILYEGYKCCSGPKAYFESMRNINEFVKAIIWILLFILKWVYPINSTDYECLYIVKSEEPFYFDCGLTLDQLQQQNQGASSNATVRPADCGKLVFREDPYSCTTQRLHNLPQVEAYMALWSIQCVLMWLTIVFYLQRTRTTGPILKMIGLMTRDMINFLVLVIIFWFAISLAIYYIVSDDLADFEYDNVDDYRQNLQNLPSCMFFGLLAILGVQNWEEVSSTSPALGLPRSLLLDGVTSLTAIVGSILLLNLLIAMLSNTFNEVSELSVLEVNYIRIVQSYSASREISLIPPPLNYFAFILMAIWFIIDLLITACTARTKMLNDWYFTPLNRTVFSAGDFIDYEEFEGGAGGKGSKVHKKGTGIKRSGYVKHQYTSEIAQIQVADKQKFVHKNQILNIKKSWITERLSDADANGICASITSSGRYYCKYCRYFFHGDQVGNIEQVGNLFKFYGILLDDDDTGKIANMLGAGATKEDRDNALLAKKKKNKQRQEQDYTKNQNRLELEEEEITENEDYNQNLRTLGVAQLCPECYRPFYCSEDHGDEIQRLQYLSEVCSFWVFMILLYVPLVVAFCIPALFSWIWNLILGKESLIGGNKAKEEKEQQNLAKKIKMTEINDTYREKVVKSFDANIPFNERVRQITERVSKIHKKIRESQADDEEDNIVTQTKEKLELRKLELTPKQGQEAMRLLKRQHMIWLEKLDHIIARIQKGKKKKRKRNRGDTNTYRYR